MTPRKNFTANPKPKQNDRMPVSETRELMRELEEILQLSAIVSRRVSRYRDPRTRRLAAHMNIAGIVAQDCLDRL